jgi:hypothetical protein
MKTGFWLFSGVGLMIPLYALIAWIVNIVKLLNCDFDAPWKDEFIHGIGLIPGVSMITCWF